MNRARVTLAAAVAAMSLSASARAATPAVPPFIQRLIEARAGDLAYVATRVPFRYRYRTYSWNPARQTLDIRFADARLPLDGRHTVVFTVRRFGGTVASCSEGRQKTLQLDGNKVYWDGRVAWRCQRTSAGRLVRMSAAGPNLPDVALGIVVASGRRVARAG